MRKLFKKHEQKFKFLLAGIWNTIFGFGLFTALFYLLPAVHYLIIAIISTVIGTTNAYISYKFFVFRTKGNYLKEYLRFYVVYGVAIALNLVTLPIMVEILHIHPVVAQGLSIFITFLVSYNGHKHFSFKAG
jgi:putative flippase GtrA